MSEELEFRETLGALRTREFPGNRIVRYFPETNLQNGHVGLKKIAQRNGINIRALGAGEFLIFVNKRKSALKMYANGDLIAHLRLEHGRIDERIIALIPRYFNGGRIDYQGAVAEVITRELGRGN